ncbi:MarR family winged helix-turn-helix transcriptional regulator [Streptomyces sp. NPDC004609]|uniref:MarR family winged helix-turn-helix transcriptional regulator n=1 Tax=Streptomyces sp. NPDC004609 TaxID=3364704 RepID=UPI0036ADE992
MDYSHDDAGLVRQPIGYWSWAAHDAVVTHIRAELAGLGLSQPQWWVLSQLAESPEGRDRTELAGFLQGYLGVGGPAIGDEIDTLLGRDLVALGPDGLLRTTASGAGLQARAAERQRAVRAGIHEGIEDEEYVRTLKVLQRMIHNVGGRAWHH